MADSRYRELGAGEPDVLAGYARLLAIDPQHGRYNGSETIYVPTPLAEVVNTARRSLYHHADNAKAWRRACAVRGGPVPDKDFDADGDAAEPSPTPSTAATDRPASLHNRTAELPGAVAVAAAQAPSRKPRVRDGHQVKVVSLDEIAKRRKDIELRHKYSTSERQAVEKMLDDLISRGPYRIVGLKKDWRALLARLRSDMPNFAKVVGRIEGCCALAQFGRTPLRIPPLLLAGPPGVGKTHFATRLADVLGVAQFVFALESAETVSVLCGTEKHWANTEPGELYRLILLGRHANPVIVLDELDKARRGGDGYRPTNALHGVLEPVTARQLRDKSVDIAFDASHVVYIATANRLSTIDASLVSRCELFYVDAPGPRAAVSIARSIGWQLIQELKLTKRFAPPASEVVQQMAMLGGPRQMHKALRAALGRAVLAGRSRVEVSDLVEGYAWHLDSDGSDGSAH